MNHHRDLMLKGGFAGPLCWYRVLVEGITPENDKSKFICYCWSSHLNQPLTISCSGRERQAEASSLLRCANKGLHLPCRSEYSWCRSDVHGHESHQRIRRWSLAHIFTCSSSEWGSFGLVKESVGLWCSWLAIGKIRRGRVEYTCISQCQMLLYRLPGIATTILTCASPQMGSMSPPSNRSFEKIHFSYPKNS